MADTESRAGGARAGRETEWLYFRTLAALLLLASVVPALFSPDLLPLLVALAALWLVAAVGAWWLVFQAGFARLRESRWYAPGVPAGRAVLLFVGVAVLLKLGGTALVDELLRRRAEYVAVGPREPVPAGKTDVSDRPYAYDLVVALGAVVGASLLVFRGWLAWLAGADDG